MKHLNLRWIFFSETLPHGQGFWEILWVAALVVVAHYLGLFAFYALVVNGYSSYTALDWTCAYLLAFGFVVFILQGFVWWRATLIALGLVLAVRGLNEVAHLPWRLELAGGFYLALRVFSMGPR